MRLDIAIDTPKFVGERFGRLTVIAQTAKKNSSNSYLFECLCDCGNTCYYPKHLLTRGGAQSCKCLRLELTQKMGQARKGKKKQTLGIKKEVTKKGNPYISKTLNQRCYESIAELSRLLKADAATRFLYVWKFKFSWKHYTLANRLISNSARRRYGLSHKSSRVTFCYFDGEAVTILVVVMSAINLLNGKYYYPLNRFTGSQAFQEVTRNHFQGSNECAEHLLSIAAGIDRDLDSPTPTVKLRAFRLNSGDARVPMESMVDVQKDAPNVSNVPKGV